MKIGEVLARRRVSLDLSQETLAKYVGTNVATIQRIENSADVDLNLRFPLARMLDLHPSILYGWSDAFWIAEDWSPEVANDCASLPRAQVPAFVAEHGIPFCFINYLVPALEERYANRETAYLWAQRLTREDIILLANLRNIPQDQKHFVLNTLQNAGALKEIPVAFLS